MYTGYEPEDGISLQIDPRWQQNLASLGQVDWMSDARQWGYPGGAPVPFSVVPRDVPAPPTPTPPTPTPPTPTPPKPPPPPPPPKPHQKTCQMCHGTGQIPSALHGTQTCPYCNGKGWYWGY